MNPSAELGRIAEDANEVAAVLRRLTRAGVEADAEAIDAIAARIRAVAAGLESATAVDGWTEVTDDPATWPKDCGPVILIESDGWCRARSTSFTRKCLERGGRIGWKWMPWPSALRAAAAGGEG